jgi:chromosome segregation ATPase
MSDEELRDQINQIAVQIEKIEQTAKQKVSYITNKVNEEFVPKISDVEGKLKHHQTILNELNQKIGELTAKKKDLLPIVKNLENEFNNLKKEKERNLNLKLKAIEKEKKTKSKEIDRQIKTLEKELKSLQNK